MEILACSQRTLSEACFPPPGQGNGPTWRLRVHGTTLAYCPATLHTLSYMCSENPPKIAVSIFDNTTLLVPHPQFDKRCVKHWDTWNFSNPLLYSTYLSLQRPTMANLYNPSANRMHMLLHVLQPSSTQSPWSRDWRRSRCKCSGERSRAFADLRATSSFGVRGLATIANSLRRCFPAFLVIQKDINMQHAISRVPFVEPVSCWTNTQGGDGRRTLCMHHIVI